jgi:hypothetical protein
MKYHEAKFMLKSYSLNPSHIHPVCLSFRLSFCRLNYVPSLSLIHSLARSFSFAYSPNYTHSLAHSPSPAHWHIRSLTPLLIRSFPISIIPLPSHSLTLLLIYILNILTLFFIHSLSPLLIRSFPISIIPFPSHSLTRLLIYILNILTLFFIHSLILLLIYLFILLRTRFSPSYTHLSHILTLIYIIPRPPTQSLSPLFFPSCVSHAFSLTRSLIHVLSHKAGYLALAQLTCIQNVPNSSRIVTTPASC